MLELLALVREHPQHGAGGRRLEADAEHLHAGAALGADVRLVSGPVALPDPAGVKTVRVESARDMLAACEASLPADAAICVAAVADWRPQPTATKKIKKGADGPPPIALTENPDILATVVQTPQIRWA